MPKKRLQQENIGFHNIGVSRDRTAVNSLLQLVLSACVAAVKSRPVLHHCVVIFFWSSGIMECTCMVFTFENGVSLMR